MKKSAIISKRHILLAVLILVLGVAVYFNWQVYHKEDTAETVNSSVGSNLGDAVLVNASSDESNENNKYFSDAKAQREEARKKSTDALKEIIDNPKSDSSAVMEANANSVKLAECSEKENSIETLVKAKGFKNALAVITDDSVSVAVECKELLPSDTVQIQEIAKNATGFTSEKIRIIEIKNS